MQELSRIKCFEGWQLRLRHDSAVCNCPMTFSLYLPPAAAKKKVPALYWLSGLTCTDENFTAKAGAQQFAAEYGIALIAPDTSPRGEGVPDDENAAYDFGLGAGFYVSAARLPWSEHYQMYDYITRELPALVGEHFPIETARQSICGHSMGGHGALTIALKNPQHYRSISAFAPIVSPMNCPWGQKALSGYIGEDKTAWRQYDTCELIAQAADAGGGKMELLIEQGLADQFLTEQLKPHLLRAACEKHNHPYILNEREGYDHSYYFIATFIKDHIAYHARALK